MIMQVKTFFSYNGRKALYVSTLAVLIHFLSACSSAPNALTYYLLHSTEVTSLPSYDFKQTIVLDNLTLPEYLKHRGLVYQTSDTNLHISTSHLWAEPVDEGITKLLTKALAKKRVSLNTTSHFPNQATIHMSLHINDFVSTYQGEVLLTGQFVIKQTSGEVKSHPFLFKSPLANDGFSSSIKAMRDTIEQLSLKITKATANAG